MNPCNEPRRESEEIAQDPGRPEGELLPGRSKLLLPPELGVEFREQRYVLSDEAFIVMHLAYEWPDETFQREIHNPTADIDTLLMNYLTTHLNPEYPELLSPFYIKNTPSDVQRDLIYMAVVCSDILADDETRQQQYAVALQSLNQVGSIFINESRARCAGREHILAHEEQHLLYKELAAPEQRLLADTFRDIIQIFEDTPVHVEDDGRTFRNMKEVLERYDDRITSDAEEFWLQLTVSGKVDVPDVLPADLIHVDVSKLVRVSVLKFISPNPPPSFDAAYRLVKDLSNSALQQGRIDSAALTAYGY